MYPLVVDVWTLTFSKKMSLSAESFVEAVESFFKWAEADKHDLIEARQFLLSLMSSIPYLEEFRDTVVKDIDIPLRGIEQWKVDNKCFSDLPFQLYQVVFDPHDLNLDEKPVMGDLHDDLADI